MGKRARPPKKGGRGAGQGSKTAPTHYQNYILREDEHAGGILSFQTPYGRGKRAHPDELLFIITHQTFELWFKQAIDEILREGTGAVARIEAGDFSAAAAALRRLSKVARLLTAQYGVIETIAPADFLKFRDVLRPSSGYDSAQFRALELASGLRGDGAYLLHLTGMAPVARTGVDTIAREVRAVAKRVEAGRPVSLKGHSIVRKLARTGDLRGLKAIAVALARHSLRDAAYRALLEAEVPDLGWAAAKTATWGRAREREWQAETDAARTQGTSWDARLDARRAAEVLRRVVAVYQAQAAAKGAASRPLFDLLEALIDYDEAFRNLRAVHINMVLRVIGGRPGTGGSTGARYLRTTLGFEFFPLLWRARDYMEGPR